VGAIAPPESLARAPAANQVRAGTPAKLLRNFAGVLLLERFSGCCHDYSKPLRVRLSTPAVKAAYFEEKIHHKIEKANQPPRRKRRE
jgi:hypothetical protein